MKKRNKIMNVNGGFSLVELIIVIAIMAVLVGVVTPQYLRYVNKAKVSVDIQLCDGIRQAMQVSLLDPNVKDAPSIPSGSDTNMIEIGSYGTEGKIANDSGTIDFWLSVYEIMGVSAATDLKAKLKLDNSATIKYYITSTGQVVVSVVDASGKSSYTGSNAITVK